MRDPSFIQQMLSKAREAGDKVTAEFSGLTMEQINWKPGEGDWSIGQCLDHLVISDCLYFPALKKIAAGNFEMSLWENWNPFSGLFGRMLVNQLQEKVNRKVKAPKIFAPPGGKTDAVILERFHKHLDTLTDCIAGCLKVDVDNIHISSPVSKFVTYSLRHAITILIQHAHRHISQAIRVKAAKGFPGLAI